jgi:hypothetical protein
MALFLVKRNDSIDYDEYDEVVVRARNAEQAKQLVLTKYWSLHYSEGSDVPGGGGAYHGFTEHNIEVDRIDTVGSPQEICASFNAG